MVTTDHETIRRWAEGRDGHPARVRRTGTEHAGRRGGLLRIDFGKPDESLERITWDEFFDAFEENGLAFLYQDKTRGETSRFFKLVDRESVSDKLEDAGGPSSKGASDENDAEDENDDVDAGNGEKKEDEDDDESTDEG